MSNILFVFNSWRMQQDILWSDAFTTTEQLTWTFVFSATAPLGNSGDYLVGLINTFARETGGVYLVSFQLWVGVIVSISVATFHWTSVNERKKFKENFVNKLKVEWTWSYSTLSCFLNNSFFQNQGWLPHIASVIVWDAFAKNMFRIFVCVCVCLNSQGLMSHRVKQFKLLSTVLLKEYMYFQQQQNVTGLKVFTFSLRAIVSIHLYRYWFI